ncbi:DnaB-like helicase C-terminal domain-containing protein [uncultured Stenotrophomonas sp.]|uniref:replicative DNA helicase n=1 Tax=uncultured Stenotrophomonas sp. TaxID=165438 RepID=UPI0028EAA528|nr:DnaB-like helicase C-terminal domain-containing protein [uncultured Stenotrophomonas sp.]
MSTIVENERAAVHQVERQVLHTAMARPSSIVDMPLQPAHFANEGHGQLWELIRSMDAGDKPVDPVTIADVAERMGSNRLRDLATAVGTDRDLYPSSQPAYQAEILMAAWRDREALDIARELQDGAQSRQGGAVDAAIQRLMALHTVDRSFEHTAQSALDAAIAQALEAQRNGGKLIGVSTGIYDLDEALGGFHDSDLIIVGARPAMGKTGFLLGATAAAAKAGPVGLISGEQPADQVGLRWLAAGSRVNVGRLRAGKFRNEEVDALLDAAERYGAMPVRILDRPSPDITEVIREARRWKHQLGIRALYVDYLQRIEIASMARAPKYQQVGSIARALKNLARDLRIPVVALAQVNREADGERPQMKHLADSSEIEKEADQIMMLWRDLSNPQAERSPAEINVVKNRHGNIGTVPVTWHGGSTSFVNRSAADELGEVA